MTVFYICDPIRSIAYLWKPSEFSQKDPKIFRSTYLSKRKALALKLTEADWIALSLASYKDKGKERLFLFEEEKNRSLFLQDVRERERSLFLARRVKDTLIKIKE